MTLLLFLLVFALGVGLLVAAGVGVLWIWSRRHPERERACSVCGRLGCTRQLCMILLQDELNRLREQRRQSTEAFGGLRIPYSEAVNSLCQEPEAPGDLFHFTYHPPAPFDWSRDRGL